MKQKELSFGFNFIIVGIAVCGAIGDAAALPDLTNDPEKLAAGEALFLSALSFGETAPAGRALIEEIL